MNQIKIDGHIFENDYRIVNAIDSEQLPVRVAVGSICKNCRFESPYLISVIKEQGVHYIILQEDYLTCEVYMIKRMLE